MKTIKIFKDSNENFYVETGRAEGFMVRISDGTRHDGTTIGNFQFVQEVDLEHCAKISVSKSLPAIDWREMRKQFFDECVEQHWITQYAPSVKKVSMAPHDLFEWFRKKLAGNVC